MYVFIKKQEKYTYFLTEKSTLFRASLLANYGTQCDLNYWAGLKKNYPSHKSMFIHGIELKGKWYPFQGNSDNCFTFLLKRGLHWKERICSPGLL